MSEERTSKHATPRDDSPRPHWYHPAIKQAATEREHLSAESHRGTARERVRRRQEDRRLPAIDWTWAVIGVALVGVVSVIALLMLATGGTSAEGGIGVAATAAAANPDRTGEPALAQPVSADVLPTVEIEPFDGKSRVTILLMGIDKRPGEAGTSFRSDTMILLSLDPGTNRLSMLSIPRDIYVPIPLATQPQGSMQPINTAYVFGELNRPGYGPRLAAETVQYNLGIPIQHYVVLSFEAVIKIIDAVGGVVIEVESEIRDDEYPDMYSYGFDPLYIPAGRIGMDGELALKYARTRHQTSDYDRVIRQQKVILALREKATRPEVLVSLVPQIPQLWEDVSTGVITDIPFDKLLSIGWYVKDIDLSNLSRGSLDGPYILATAYNGGTVVTINRNTITELMVNVFGENYNR